MASDEPNAPGTDRESGDVVSGDSGEVLATVNLGAKTWELTAVVCIAGVDSLDFLASTGLIGVSGDTTLAVKVIGDWSGDSGGEIASIDISLVEGDLVNPVEAWQSTLDVGAASVSTSGNRVQGDGRFDDLLTQGNTESQQGSFQGECPEDLVEPEVIATTIPAYEANGTVSVGGEVFMFTYDAPGGICGQDAGDGKLASHGVLVDDPSRQVVFTYALPETTSDGNPAFQLVINAADGSQLWYSAIGYGFDVGSIESLTREGDTVTATGTLLRSGSNPEDYVEFTAEATCSQ